MPKLHSTRWSIFASKDTGTNSKVLRRFDTPDEYHAPELANAYTQELRRQGWNINEISEVDEDGSPIQQQRGGRRVTRTR